MASSGENKVALVTGSTQGIGLSTAKVLAEAGCDVVITGFGTEEQIAAARSDVASSGPKVHYVSGDLRNPEDINSMVSEVFKLYPQGIDILVNNAGFNHVAPVDEYPEEMWNDMLSVMLTAPFLLTKRFVPAMKQKRWGRIVNMSSQMGMISTPGKAPYSAVKSGLIGFTKGVALDVAEFGITCNAVCPTYAMTDIVEKQIAQRMEKDGLSYEEAKASFAALIPVRELIAPAQIADFVRYLCFSEAAPLITGAAHLLDGGYTAQ